MENKKLLVLLLLLGGGYLVWKNSKNTPASPVSSGTGSGPTTGTPSEYGTGEVITGSEYAPSDFPQSQKDCPEGTVFQAVNCITTPCYGGNCVPVEPTPVDLPVEALPEPKKPVFDPLSPLDESGFSFLGYDKNTLALQGSLKEGLVKQSNFN